MAWTEPAKEALARRVWKQLLEGDAIAATVELGALPYKIAFEVSYRALVIASQAERERNER